MYVFGAIGACLIVILFSMGPAAVTLMLCLLSISWMLYVLRQLDGKASVAVKVLVCVMAFLGTSVAIFFALDDRRTGNSNDLLLPSLTFGLCGTILTLLIATTVGVALSNDPAKGKA